MIKFTDITYSILRALREKGLDITDEESQAAGEQSLLLTVDGVQPKILTFDRGLKQWQLHYTIIGNASSKATFNDLVDDYLSVFDTDLGIDLYTVDGTAVVSASGLFVATGPAMMSLPYSWSFNQQFRLDINEEAN